MIVDPKTASPQDCYKLMIGGIVPRPIAFVSTLSAEGQPNLAPFSYFTAITSSPPTICFSPGRRYDTGEKKDTLRNIEAVGEFVVNVVTEDIGKQMNETATDFPPGTNEFEVSGLTAVPSRIVTPPRVAESPINMECKLYKVVPIGPDGPGGGTLVIGEIVLFHIDDRIYEDGRINVEGLRPLGRLAGALYTTLGKIVTMKRKTYRPTDRH